MKQLLLVKMSSLGDVVHALPAVSDALAHGWTVDWVVEEAFADIARALPQVRQVIPIAWRRWRKSLGSSREELAAFDRRLRQVDYDVVLDSQGLIKSALVAVRARGPRVGYSHTSAREPWAAFGYSRRIKIPGDQHAITRQRQLFAAALGYQYDTDATVALGNPDTTTQRQVLLLHGTTWESKHWPQSMWTSLIGLINSSGYEAVVTWGDEIEQTRAQVLKKAGATLLDRQALSRLITTLKQMSGVISVDSGLGHLSAVLGIPTVGLYGPTSGALTGVTGPRAMTVQGEAHCVPCLNKQCRYRGPELLWQEQVVQPPCFASVTPERVWAEAQKLMTDS